MIKTWLINSDKVTRDLSTIPMRLSWKLADTIDDLSEEIADHIREDYLSGQVLNSITGTGRDSIRPVPSFERSDGAIVGGVAIDGNSAPYMVYLNEGWEAHRIYPSTKKALAFVWKEKMWILRSVWNKGWPGSHFMEDGLADYRFTIRRKMEAVVNRIIK